MVRPPSLVAFAIVSFNSLPMSVSSSMNSSRLELKCWYSTGLVTPAASATSFIDVAVKPFSANTVHGGAEQLFSSFGSRKSHRVGQPVPGLATSR